MEVNGALAASGALQPPPPHDSITSFPTVGQSISDTMLKEALLSLRASLHADIVSGVTQCQVNLLAMGERINHIETTMGEYSSFKMLVDAHSDHKEKNDLVKRQNSQPGGQIEKE